MPRPNSRRIPALAATTCAVLSSAACGSDGDAPSKAEAERLVSSYVRDSLGRPGVEVDSMPVFKPVDTTRVDGQLARRLYGAEHVATFNWHDGQRHGTGTAGFKHGTAGGWAFAIKPELEVTR